jgi:DHA2 family multidrug resistance protein
MDVPRSTFVTRPRRAALPAAPPPVARRDVTEFGVRRLLIVIGVMAAALMQTLDSTITNVALPTIQGNLGASLDEGTWVVTSYVIAAIIVIPLTPWLQNRFGRKRYFLVSIAGFTLASIACGAAQNLDVLIISRVVQGAFGGGLLATSQAILRETFPPRQLGASQAIFALGAIMGPALGPPLGGFLVDNASWNWVFDINIVPGTLAIVLLGAMLRDPTDPYDMPADFVGLGFLTVSLGTMQYIFTEGERHDWLSDPTIAATSVVCLVSSVLFVWYELYGTRTPIVDLRILANRSVAAGCAIAAALGAVVFGSTYAIPQLTQSDLGFTPTLSGELFILRAVPIALCTPLVVRFSSRVDTRVLLGIGFVGVAVGTALQALVTTGLSSYWTFAPALIIVGAGSAFLWTPLAIAVLGATTPSEGPKAGAMINLATQLGGSAAVALLDVVVDQRMTFHSEVLGGNATLRSIAVQHFLAGSGGLQQLSAIVGREAAILAYADATWAIALVAAICTPLVFLMRKPRPMRPAAGSTAQIAEA